MFAPQFFFRINMKDVLSSKNYNKKVKLKCIVSGKSIAPYCVPRKIVIECTPAENMSCSKCKFNKNKILEILPTNENILQFIDIQTTTMFGTIQKMFSILCWFTYEIKEMQNVERLFIIPQTNNKIRNKLNIAPISYYAGIGIDVNTSYLMEGYTTLYPKDQTTVHVFTSAKKVKSDAESFELTKEKHKELMQFNKSDLSVEDIYDYLDKLYLSYAHNITKIYDRFDLHLAVDLAFRSVLSFKFDNEIVHKGWMDIMIIGDTRCGKGYVAEKLAAHFNLGEVISGDNISFAGLVGGLQQYNKQWVITWGKIPLNDCGLVIIDEASEIKTEDWTRLSRIRSEGIAEITKINTQSTHARTRVIFISNPILKTIANYSYGIQALVDIVKAPEDIARFDYVLVVAHNEVEIKDINRRRELVKEIYTKKLEQDLILWTWSKSQDEIMFSSEATQLIYDISIKLSKIYTFSIPLIQGENIRIKLAKIAIAFAARLYSHKQNGKYLFVDKIHVECAYHFLNLIYKKNSCGYYAMSKLQNTQELYSTEKDFSAFEKYLKAFTLHRVEICKCLLVNNALTVNDISEHVNLDKEIAREIISKLLINSCIIKRGNIYVKVPAFVNWLKHKILENEKGGF